MSKNNIFHVQVQPPEDLIDFPISDSFRDYFALKGLTHSSGRRYLEIEGRHRDSEAQESRNKELARERDEWISRAMQSDARCEQLEEKYERLQRQYNKLNQQAHRFQRTPESNESQEYRGVDLDDCA